MPARVISVRGKKRDQLLDDPGFVYVGREFAGWSGSIWGNPYRVSPEGWGCRTAKEAVEKFLTYLNGPIEQARIMRSRITELRGKTLGCWCGFWEPGQPEIDCHAVVLAKLANHYPDSDWLWSQGSGDFPWED